MRFSTFIKKVRTLFIKKVEKRQLWVRPCEWLELNFASCVVHQTRSYNMAFAVCTSIPSVLCILPGSFLPAPTELARNLQWLVLQMLGYLPGGPWGYGDTRYVMMTGTMGWRTAVMTVATSYHRGPEDEGCCVQGTYDSWQEVEYWIFAWRQLE